MGLATMGFWIATGMIGLYMFGITLRLNTDGDTSNDSHLPSLVVFTHATLAFVGLAVLLTFVGVGGPVLAWTTFGIVLVVAALGSYMGLRWLLDRHGRKAKVEANKLHLVEQQIPSAAVHTHGALAFLTIIMVLITALRA